MVPHLSSACDGTRSSWNDATLLKVATLEEVTVDRTKEAMLAIQSFSNGSSPSAEDGCLDAVARSLGISDLSDTAHISHLLEFVSYLRRIR
jgi:hypothetical protein